MFKAKATRDEFIATLSGYAFPVTAGEIYEFPDIIRTEAILAGCIPVEVESSVPVMSETDRADAIFNACAEILAKKEPRHIAPEGFPKVGSLKKMIGFEPTIEEVVAACKELTQEN